MCAVNHFRPETFARPGSARSAWLDDSYPIQTRELSKGIHRRGPIGGGETARTPSPAATNLAWGQEMPTEVGGTPPGEPNRGEDTVRPPRPATTTVCGSYRHTVTEMG